ncbi:MAG: hypothetical protein LQ349_003629 [Xanthoria aureola]|nr:MAG: hypothetical protein LQ349_003629 [Xanthoria aureola]
MWWRKNPPQQKEGVIKLKRYKAASLVTVGVGVASDRIHTFESRGENSYVNRGKLRRDRQERYGQIQKTQACYHNTNTTSRLIAPRACRRTQSSLAPKRTVISSPLLLAPIRPASLNNNNSQQQQQPDPANNNNQPEGTDDFESFYLQQVTAEFADDLDKLRNASDFTEKSMPVLIEALKDTARTYSEEEKEEVMGRGR